MVPDFVDLSTVLGDSLVIFSFLSSGDRRGIAAVCDAFRAGTCCPFLVSESLDSGKFFPSPDS